MAKKTAPDLTPEEKILHSMFGFSRPGPRKSRTPMSPKREASLRLKIEEVLKALTEQERRIIKLRYGLYSGGATYTLDEVADELDMPREKVRKIESGAIRKIQHPLAPKLPK